MFTWSLRRALAALLLGILLAASDRASADIIEISVPVGSQSYLSRPAMDEVWSVTSQGGTLPITLGIGIIVNPVWVSALDFSDFALHQNEGLGTVPYASPYVPNPSTSTVTYRFDKPTIVSGVEIVQHPNGVTRISGMLDGQSLGAVFGPSGDVIDNLVVPNDGVSQVFNFANTTVAGKEFKLTITKSNHILAFALHRAFLLDTRGNRIAPAAGPSTGGPVGGLVHGVSGTKEVACTNLTTGQSISFNITTLSWNCEQKGLQVQAGDIIEQTVRGAK